MSLPRHKLQLLRTLAAALRLKFCMRLLVIKNLL